MTARPKFWRLRGVALSALLFLGAASCSHTSKSSADLTAKVEAEQHVEQKSAEQLEVQSEKQTAEAKTKETTREEAPTEQHKVTTTVTPVLLKKSDGTEILAYKRQRERTETKKGAVKVEKKEEARAGSAEKTNAEEKKSTETKVDSRVAGEVKAAIVSEKSTDVLGWKHLLGIGLAALVAGGALWKVLPWARWLEAVKRLLGGGSA